MFGFNGGESVATVERKRRYMVEAQQRWPFLTYYDASTIKNPEQLVTMVKDRTSQSQAAAEKDVSEWMVGRDFQLASKDRRA
jgi:hypothetical protein